jgi:hypothetical protein
MQVLSTGYLCFPVTKISITILQEISDAIVITFYFLENL